MSMIEKERQKSRQEEYNDNYIKHRRTMSSKQRTSEDNQVHIKSMKVLKN
jgi:hypothetical protein